MGEGEEDGDEEEDGEAVVVGVDVLDGVAEGFVVFFGLFLALLFDVVVVVVFLIAGVDVVGGCVFGVLRCIVSPCWKMSF